MTQVYLDYKDVYGTQYNPHALVNFGAYSEDN
jgi:hypothetical protein